MLTDRQYQKLPDIDRALETMSLGDDKSVWDLDSLAPRAGWQEVRRLAHEALTFLGNGPEPLDVAARPRATGYGTITWNPDPD
jgi:hypothetical protein